MPKYQVIISDSLNACTELATNSVDLVLTSPPYPSINREYGIWHPEDWLGYMSQLMHQLRRVVKPTGSAVIVIEPNSERVGQRHDWPYRFVLNSMHSWNLVQDAYWIKLSCMPSGGATRHGLMRTATEWCLWFGEPDCYRNQKQVLWEYSPTHMQRVAQRAHMSGAGTKRPSGHVEWKKECKDNGGSTPMNWLPCSPASYDGHPACYPQRLCDYWIKYLSPPSGVVLDPFSGSGTTGVSALQNGRTYIGVERDKSYAEKSISRLHKIQQANRYL